MLAHRRYEPALRRNSPQCGLYKWVLRVLRVSAAGECSE